MPKSVKSPVKCVVRTAALEILVTREFCSPIAKSRLQAINLVLQGIRLSPKTAIKNSIRLSIETGSMYKWFSFFLESSSTKKLEKKEPRKKKNIYRKYIKPFQKLSLKISSTKKAKWPVTLVVNVAAAKNPATFTIPATKESREAI